MGLSTNWWNNWQVIWGNKRKLSFPYIEINSRCSAYLNNTIMYHKKTYAMF